MLKYVRKAWDWLKHDFIGKVLFSFALLVIFWSKWSATRYLIDYYCGNKYIPGFLESLYSLSPRLDNKGVFVECTFKLLWTFVIINFLRAAFGDPGFMDKMNLEMPKNVLPDKLEKTCIKCDNIWKPPRAHHCKTCKKCILRMDHHCEWIANCVGAKNQKFFILFLVYGVTYSLFVIALSIMGLMLWLMEYPLNKKTQAPFTDAWGSVNRIMLGIGAIFFLLFTFDFLWEQMEGVLKNQSVVESHQVMHGRPRKFMPSMDKVFGVNRWAWLLPVAPKLRVNTLEMLYHEIDVNSQDKPKDEKDKFKEDEFEKLPIYEKYFMK